MPNDLANLMGDGTGPAIIPVRQTTDNVSVTREGEVVCLKLGRNVVRMKYKMAMMVGQWLLARGAEAKFLASDSQRLVIERR